MIRTCCLITTAKRSAQFNARRIRWMSSRALAPLDTLSPDAASKFDDAAAVPKWFQQQKYPSRTHLCNDIDIGNNGQRVTLCGWTMLSRPMGMQLLFMPLRDGSGIAQLVFNDPSLIIQAQRLRQESVVCVEGTVRQRPQENFNSEMRSGRVEVLVERIHLLNPAPERLPFLPLDKAVQQANDELRGKYRYLDLRRPEMQRNIRIRSSVAQTVRTVLNNEGSKISFQI